MRHMKLCLVAILICAAGLAAGCGGSNQDIGSTATLPPAWAAGRANISGRLYAPAGVSGAAAARSGMRTLFQANTFHDIAVAFASLAVYTMNADGQLVPLDSTYIATTDINGDFTIYYVLPVNNAIILGTKTVQINGQSKNINLKSIISIHPSDVMKGIVTGVDVDAATSLTVAAMQQAVQTINANLPADQQITGADLPTETLNGIYDAVQAALAADQALASPAVDILGLVTEDITTTLTGTDTVAVQQLTNLTNSPGGATLATAITDLATKGSIRVTVLNASGAAIPGATVTVTVGGAAQSKTADSAGQALFGALTPLATATISVSAQGYASTTTSATVSSAGRVASVTLTLSASTTTAEPSVNGVVTSGGQPVADAAVALYNSAFSASTTTDSAGAYAFYDVPSGTYNILATKENYTLESSTVVVP